MLLENLKNLIIPQGKIFYTYLISVAENNCKMSALLIEVCKLKTREERTGPAMKIEKLEAENDEITHKIFIELGKIFLTPIPREEIHVLAGSLDDVADLINSISRHMYLISPGLNDELILQFAVMIDQCSKKIVQMLNNMAAKQNDSIFDTINFVNQTTSDSANLYEQALENLYKTENDFKLFIRLREVFMVMEEAMKKCHAVAITVENIILTNIE